MICGGKQDFFCKSEYIAASAKSDRIRSQARCFDVGFFQAVLAKNEPGQRKSNEEFDHAIRQIIAKAMVSDEVVDIFAAAGA